MSIYNILRDDHQEIKELMNELVSLSKDDDYRYTLIDNISHRFIAHSRAEEAVFYNSIKAAGAVSGEVAHGFKVHGEIESLLKFLQNMDHSDTGWKEAAMRLKDTFSAHVADEEGQIFTLAQRVFTSDDANKIGQAFVRIKSEFTEHRGLSKDFKSSEDRGRPNPT